MRCRRGEGAPRERGFTIVEMVVVVTVLAVLVGMAIPTFVAAYWRSQDHAAKTHLRAAAKAAWVYAVEQGGFEDDAVALAELEAIEPEFSFVDGSTASADEKTVSVADDAGGAELAMAIRAANGTCFYVRLSEATQESQHQDDAVASCRAADYVDGPNSGW